MKTYIAVTISPTGFYDNVKNITLMDVVGQNIVLYREEKIVASYPNTYAVTLIEDPKKDTIQNAMDELFPNKINGPYCDPKKHPAPQTIHGFPGTTLPYTDPQCGPDCGCRTQFFGGGMSQPVKPPIITTAPMGY